MKHLDFGYSLDVRLTITKKQWIASGDDGYWQNQHDERMSIEEGMDLGSLDFYGLLSVLAQLHDAVNGIRVAEKDKGGKAPNTGNNSSQKRDDKMSTTEKSKDPKRPHTDR